MMWRVPGGTWANCAAYITPPAGAAKVEIAYRPTSTASRSWAAVFRFADIDITAGFTDASFRAAVYDAVGKTAPAPILDFDVEEITALDVSGRGIESLAGLAWFTGLESLDCSGNWLEELDVTGLPLRDLNCSYNNMTGEADVIGLKDEWDGEDCIFAPQYSNRYSIYPRHLVIPPVYTDGDGNPMDCLSDDAMTVTFFFRNNSNIPVTLNLLLGVYSPTGLMTNTGADTKTIGAFETVMFQASLYMPQNVNGLYASEGYHTKAFLWDSAYRSYMSDTFIFPNAN